QPRRFVASGRAMLTYLGIVAVLLVVTVRLPDPAASIPLMVINALGAAALAFGVARQRPPLQGSWWLVVAGGATAALAALVVTEGPALLSGTLRAQDWVTATLSAIAFGLLITGLAGLGQLAGR